MTTTTTTTTTTKVQLNKIPQTHLMTH